MKWKKLGLVFAPDRNHDWMVSHAAVPFAVRLRDDIFRIYFSCRDSRQRSHVGFVDIGLNHPQKILRVSDRPVLAPGVLGAFDDSGAMLSWITEDGSKRYLYYNGWNLGVTVPFRNSAGVAIGAVGQDDFRRLYDGPILDRSMTEPYFSTTPCVLIDGERWKMWYLSCVGWELTDGSPRHRYHIKYAESPDPIHWERKGLVCIDFESPDEYAITRPCILKDAHVYKMWYSHRGAAYRIGYAESVDGIHWVRKDKEAGIEPSDAGWDSEMIEYAHVFDAWGKRYMLYNGNGYGKTGFGMAVLVD